MKDAKVDSFVTVTKHSELRINKKEEEVVKGGNKV